MTLFTSPVRTIRTELRGDRPLVVFTHFDGQCLPVKI